MAATLWHSTNSGFCVISKTKHRKKNANGSNSCRYPQSPQPPPTLGWWVHTYPRHIPNFRLIRPWRTCCACARGHYKLVASCCVYSLYAKWAESENVIGRCVADISSAPTHTARKILSTVHYLMVKNNTGLRSNNKVCY